MKSALIIEDSESINKLWRKVARKCWYFSIDSAETIDEARSLLKNKKYDLIVTDVHMDGGTATDLLIEEKEKVKDTKIVIISAINIIHVYQIASKMIAEGLNVVESLGKPVDIKILKALL